MIRVVSADEARLALVSHLGLARFERQRGTSGIRAVLQRLRSIQLDPLDPIGQNADLVVIARVRGAKRGDVHRALYPGHAFEHFAKERCILPASAFPQYRNRGVETPWWRHTERTERVPKALVDEVLREIEERGPLTTRELLPRGAVKPIDWSGWTGTSSAAKLAVDILWTHCAVVVAGRRGRDKLFDVPRRALPAFIDTAPDGDFATWALKERVLAAGMLPMAPGPCWSMLKDVRTSRLPRTLVEQGVIEEVQVAGARRTYLAPGGLFDARPAPVDEHMRILGPLDPVLWDRRLVADAFDFDYVWEVYKPAAERRWGWYVCPLYHRGHMVGRMEATVRGTRLEVDRVWREEGRALDEDALGAALERHAEACGCDAVKVSKSRRRPRPSSSRPRPR